MTPEEEAAEHLAEYGCNVYHPEGTCRWQSRCDEPGCLQEATVGQPTENGYRRTCSDHRVRS